MGNKRLGIHVCLKHLRDLLNALPGPGQAFDWDKLEERKKLTVMSLEYLEKLTGEGFDPPGWKKCPPRKEQMPNSQCKPKWLEVHLDSCDLTYGSIRSGEPCGSETPNPVWQP